MAKTRTPSCAALERAIKRETKNRNWQAVQLLFMAYALTWDPEEVGNVVGV